MSKSKTFEILTLSIILLYGSLLNVFSQAIEIGNDHNKYFKISGNITSNDGPIPYAYVSIEELQMNTVADGNGHFEFKRIPVGTYKIETQNLGYVDAKKTVTVANGDINITAATTMSKSTIWRKTRLFRFFPSTAARIWWARLSA